MGRNRPTPPLIADSPVRRVNVKEQEVAEITALSLSKLRQDRCYGRGIPFMKLGKAVRYDLADVYAFLDKSKVTFDR